MAPLDGHELLGTLAERVRDIRAGRGWTRAELARRSGLSVRFLARIEAGDGNVSLVRLAALARALDTTPAELIRSRATRPRIVALVGMRGAGKSTVGRLLAQRLGRRFVEMDALIEETSGLPLDQLFELHGERYYRRLERETLVRILAGGESVVLAASGGVVNEPSTWEMLLRDATVVWLRARPEDHWQRVVGQGDRRPMADNPHAMAELRAMLAARESSYAEAPIAVDTADRAPETVADAVRSQLVEPPAGGARPPWPPAREPGAEGVHHE